MHKTNIFLVIEALSMLVSPQIKTVKPPDKKPGISDRSSFLRRRSFNISVRLAEWLCYNIPLAGLLQNHVGFRDSSSEYQKFFVCWGKMCLMVVFYESVRFIETTTCQRLVSVGNLN